MLVFMLTVDHCLAQGKRDSKVGRSGKTPLNWGHIKSEVIFDTYKKIRVGNKQK